MRFCRTTFLAAVSTLGLLVSIWSPVASLAQSSGGSVVRLGLPLPAAPRFLHQGVWDPATEKVYIFGGLAKDDDSTIRFLDELWEFDPAAGKWTPLHANEGPGGRAAFACTWDTRRHLMLVAGGARRDLPCISDLWSLEPSTGQWLQRSSGEPSPELRRFHSLTYDPIDDRALMMFGNCIDLPYRSYDAYVPDSDAWVGRRFAPVTMGLRARHVAAFDPSRRRILVYGGYAPGYALSPGEEARWQMVWSYDPAVDTWEQLMSGDAIPERRMASIASYDPYLDALIVYGGVILPYPGTGSSYVTNELWAYLLGPQRWSKIDIEGLPPRAEAAGVYCASTGEMYAFGGVDTQYIGIPEPIHSETIIIPLEVPAVFVWDPGVTRGDSQGAVRWGRLSIGALDSPIENVRLMNCETGVVLDHATIVRRIGREAWHVAFGRATGEEEAAARAGRLVVAGKFADETRAFLARPTSRVATGSHKGAQTTPSRSPELPAIHEQIVSRRDVGRWIITFPEIGPTDERLLIVDVSGRIRLATSNQFLHAGSGHFEFAWDGRGDSGARLLRGIYFARIAGHPEFGSARILLE